MNSKIWLKRLFSFFVNVNILSLKFSNLFLGIFPKISDLNPDSNQIDRMDSVHEDFDLEDLGNEDYSEGNKKKKFGNYGSIGINRQGSKFGDQIDASQISQAFPTEGPSTTTFQTETSDGMPSESHFETSSKFYQVLVSTTSKTQRIETEKNNNKDPDVQLARSFRNTGILHEKKIFEILAFQAVLSLTAKLMRNINL